MIPISYNVRSLIARKTTTIATAFGIGLVVFILATTLMLAAGINKTLADSGGRENAIVLRKGTDSELASAFKASDVGLILAAPAVKRDATGNPIVSGELVVVIALSRPGTDEGQIANVQVRGVTESAFRLRPDVKIVEGRLPKPGTDEVIVGKGIAGSFRGLSLGGQVELKKNRPITVVGLFEAGGSATESEIWADIDTVRTSFGRHALVSSVTVQLESISKYDVFESAIELDKQLELEVQRERSYFESRSENTSGLVRLVGVLIAALISLGAMMGASITMTTAVAQRQREIGTLRALGFSRFSILMSFLIESSVLALFGSLLGAACALLLSFVRISMTNFLTYQQVSFRFDTNPRLLFISIIIGAGMGVIAGFFPAIRAARVSPVVAMRG